MFPISVEIDGITNCLIDYATGEEVETFYELVFPPFDSYGWEHDWNRMINGADGTYELYTCDGELQGRLTYSTEDYFYMDYIESAPHNNVHQNGYPKKYQGVGAHLCAIACKLSFDLGYNGVVRFLADIGLTEHYLSIGACIINEYDNLMEFDTESALDLIEAYRL